MKSYYKANRSNGKSDRVIIYELFSDKEPETVIAHKTLLDALREGLPFDEAEKITLQNIYRVIHLVNEDLLENKQRYITSVRGKGYKLIHAREHVPVAAGKKQKANNYLKQGLKVLKETRLHELSHKERALHLDQQMIMQQNVQLLDAAAEEKARKEKIFRQAREQNASTVINVINN